MNIESKKTMRRNFMKIGKRVESGIICAWIKLKKNDGFGMNELLGIAAAIILAAFIIIPELKNFATSVMDKLDTWWSGTIMTKIFPTT